MKFIVVNAAIILVLFYACLKYVDSPQFAAKKIECEIPNLVSEVGGLKLYSVRPNCGYKVYFSNSVTVYKNKEK